jgi:predicted lipid-binding transport protein (Tim44 family)
MAHEPSKSEGNTVKRLFAAALLAFVGFGLIAATSAEARRLGGGRSVGMQRQATPPRDTAQAPSAAPTQPAAIPGTPARPGMGRWLAPLAAFGLGAALMSMFGGNMMAGAFGNLLMLLLLGAAVFAIVRMLRNRTAQQRPLQFAGMPRGAEPGPAFSASPVSPTNALVGSVSAVPAQAYPPGFDAEGFLRQAKVSYIRLQAANDAGDVRDIRDYTTPELYAELAMQIQERGASAQKTDVLTLNTEMLSVVEEEGRAIASVRFTGLVREEEGKDALAIDETWHVVKESRDRKAPWLVAGIQQNA